MFRLRRVAAFAAPLLVLVAAGTSDAAGLGTSASPTAQSLGLTQADVRGGIPAFSGLLQSSAGPQYVRMFLPRTPTGSTVDSVVVLEPDALYATAAITTLGTYAQTDAGRQTLSKMLVDGMSAVFSSAAFRARFAITGTPHISNPVLGRVSQPSPGTIVLPNTISISGHRVYVVYAYVQVDRAIQAVEMFNLKHAPSSSALAGYIAKARAHMRKGFTVTNAAPPTISGTPSQGQTLSLDAGGWTGGVATFGYAWQRCAADGSACVPIDGATGSSYTVSGADAASTIRVVITGSNSVSQAQATSTPTLVS